MTTTILTTKGQVVIPSEVRKRHHLKEGTKLCVLEEGERIVLQPLTRNYFSRMAGIVQSGKSLTKTLLEERTQEKAREDKKWH